MAFPVNLILTLVSFSSLLHLSSATFTPPENYLLNCGATTNTSFFSTRSFLGDSSTQGSTFLTADRSISLSDQNPPPDSPALYHTARIFPGGSPPSPAYKLHLTTTNATHFIRLHFAPFKASNFNLKSAKFSVLINGFSVLNTFTTNTISVKEFILKIDSFVLEISFLPAKASTFSFINAIEVFSAPKDYIIDRLTVEE
ncbi:unnamed protein product [Eruca vesicaria subsp. sativa]|uniref:Malectin-like domain-containing protein n=1 Tax=Eruca vesicaria subsp. sativa TaxID=29727 RepID=A0ABC8JKE1_ERUVS|nr:unnamed protein product [Eruca vesicaria subsp. sativa]